MTKLVQEFIKVCDTMENGDYARIAMIETLTTLALNSGSTMARDIYYELRGEVLNSVE